MIPNPWLIGGVGVVIAALGIGIWLQTSRLHAAQETASAVTMQRDQWKADFAGADQAAKINAEMVDTLMAKQKAVEAIADQSRADAVKSAAQYDDLKRSLRNAPKTDDGPIAPVLARALAGLRQSPN